ncbi:DMT family transporter [Tolumonas osonensis]|uniref:Drug/metabolite transporter (DMT)-like permease n=1 Tax=Tolumonas osonensis TaxID=675874 RepID=A0A841GN15_9GAMM|nr:DMT family transporter [Tolumonas osonensis]MBB6056140.1 drug/metabolite transporter (DMT)-like permease [Tolumonas osonensis]
MFTGVLFALAAGAMWGLIFIGPVLIPEYPAALQSVGRYLAFGLICLPLAWQDRRRLSALNRADWLEALKLAAIGNLLYYFFLSSAIQQIGVPISSMIIGVLPVVVTICSNISYSHRDGKFAWRDLLPSLALVLAGLVCVNLAELQGKTHGYDVPTYLSGIAFAFMAVACWTWYPMRNANWLRVNTTKSPVTWATAQGIATLPLAILGYGLVWYQLQLVQPSFDMPLGPRPWVFIALMSTIGLLCSWLGTLCWNQASQRLPTALAGQLIVFETLAGLTYAFLLRQEFPSLLTMIGVMILMLGVLKSFRIKRIMPLQSTS